MALIPKLEALKDRGLMLKRARHFFDERHILEVDCPMITNKASVDAHIDLISILYQRSEKKYLHSSPEYGMKRLLAEGIGDIYQLAHVFRDGEHSLKHNPEFMMAEWYRLNLSFQEMIDETLAFVRLFLGPIRAEIHTYRSTFEKYANIDYLSFSEAELFSWIQQQAIPYYSGIEYEGKDALLNLILGSVIEPKLGQDCLYVLTHYPASQAALAKKTWRQNEEVANRFEIYYQGVELANGYDELTNEEEQRFRLMEANEFRKSMGKEVLPIDESFLAALEKGIPNSCGVAVGFDRLMMLRLKAFALKEVLPWDWLEA